MMKEMGLIEIDRFFSSMESVALVVSAYEFHLREDGTRWSELTEAMLLSKINYIHQNPVKRGYVDEAVHWRYSSARDYQGMDGLSEIDRFW